jgi:hypothetical protein
MDIESIFAAEIFNAPKEAALAQKHGFPSTVSDVVAGALADLWHYDNTRAQAIADKYVWYDADDNPWPRDDIDWGNVVAL